MKEYKMTDKNEVPLGSMSISAPLYAMIIVVGGFSLLVGLFVIVIKVFF